MASGLSWLIIFRSQKIVLKKFNFLILKLVGSMNLTEFLKEKNIGCLNSAIYVIQHPNSSKELAKLQLALSIPPIFNEGPIMHIFFLRFKTDENSNRKLFIF